MAVIDKRTRTLFFTTSPRTPQKMVPEIKLLIEEFEGHTWAANRQLQNDYMKLLAEKDFFHGDTSKDLAFSARDRITRGPKALGFVDLQPAIKLTPAGDAFVNGVMGDEALLRQLLKFQLPSPYHAPNKSADTGFFVKPYLEIIRLVRHFGSLTFDELKLFGLQLTDYTRFEEVVGKIEAFRIGKARNKGKYKKYLAKQTTEAIYEIYKADIVSGDIGTRESDERTLARFVKTKGSNLRDYADACFRYLRATGIVNISQVGHTLSIAPDRTEDVDFILRTVDPKPVHIYDEKAYKEYLFDAETPKLLTDDFAVISGKLAALGYTGDISRMSVLEAKTLEKELRAKRKAGIIEEKVREIKDCREYDDIQSVFDNIGTKVYYDNPLMLEWNSWRAMTMIDGGNVVGNFNMDDNGLPLSTAAGNTPDIVCEYGDFDLIVEVTLQSGQKQYDNEGEPVARHLGKHKKKTGREAFCLFIAPKISEATIAHFYALHQSKIKAYGGKAVIVPMDLAVYRKMLEDSYKAAYTPNPQQVRAVFEKSRELAATADDEMEWYEGITDYALNWLG